MTWRKACVLAVIFCTSVLTAAGEDRERLAPAELAILRTLKNTRINLNFVEAPFPELVIFIGNLTNVNAIIDRSVIAKPGMGGNVTINVKNVPTLDALDVMLELLDLTRIFQHNVLLITTHEHAERLRPTTIRVHDVRALADASTLPRELAAAVAPGTWGVLGRWARLAAGRLVVSQTAAVQDLVALYLARQIGSSRRLAVVLELRRSGSQGPARVHRVELGAPDSGSTNFSRRFGTLGLDGLLVTTSSRAGRRDGDGRQRVRLRLEARLHSGSRSCSFSGEDLVPEHPQRLASFWFGEERFEVHASARDADRVLPATIARWIAQLGHSTLRNRQRATQRLVEAGPVVLPSLKKAQGHKDREVAFRARKILRALGGSASRDVPHAMWKRLEAIRVQNLNFDGQQLPEVLSFLHSTYQVNIVAHPRVLALGKQALAVNLRLRNLDLRNALQLIVTGLLRLDLRIAYGVYVVDLKRSALVFKVLDVADVASSLLRPGAPGASADRHAGEWLRSAVHPKSWSRPGCFLVVRGGVLAARNRAGVLKDLEKTLHALRSSVRRRTLEVLEIAANPGVRFPARGLDGEQLAAFLQREKARVVRRLELVSLSGSFGFAGVPHVEARVSDVSKVRYQLAIKTSFGPAQSIDTRFEGRLGRHLLLMRVDGEKETQLALVRVAG